MTLDWCFLLIVYNFDFQFYQDVCSKSCIVQLEGGPKIPYMGERRGILAITCALLDQGARS